MFVHGTEITFKPSLESSFIFFLSLEDFFNLWISIIPYKVKDLTTIVAKQYNNPFIYYTYKSLSQVSYLAFLSVSMKTKSTDSVLFFFFNVEKIKNFFQYIVKGQ